MGEGSKSDRNKKGRGRKEEAEGRKNQRDGEDKSPWLERDTRREKGEVENRRTLTQSQDSDVPAPRDPHSVSNCI